MCLRDCEINKIYSIKGSSVVCSQKCNIFKFKKKGFYLLK